MNELVAPSTDNNPIPAFAGGQLPDNLREAIGQAVDAWLMWTPSPHTRKAYKHDLNQFLAHAGIEAGAFEQLPQVRPHHVTVWREQLAAAGMTNASITRKLTVLRSLFSYLKTYGYSSSSRLLNTRS